MTPEQLEAMRMRVRLDATTDVMLALTRLLAGLLPDAPTRLQRAGNHMQQQWLDLAFSDRDPAQSELLAGEAQDALAEVWRRVISEAERASSE